MIPILLILLLCLPGLATGATYYVSTTGSNSNDGSEENPWLTIQHAVNSWSAGDTILVRGGTYTSNGSTIRIDITGTASQPITLKNYPGERPIINWTDKNNTSNRIYATRGGGLPVEYLTIEGFEIRGGYEGMKCQGPTKCNHLVFRRNWVHDMRNQGFLGGAPDGLFELNIFQHNGNFACTDCTKQHGLYLDGDNIVIRNNIFLDNLAYGVQQAGSGITPLFSGNWRVVNNTFAYQNHRGGQVVWGTNSDNATMENNIYFENSQEVSNSFPQGIDCSGCSGISGAILRNNHAYATTPGATTFRQAAFVSPVDTGNIVNVSPPSFVTSTLAGADLRIASVSSPTVDMGRTQPDIASCGPAPDAGAFEMPRMVSATINGNTMDMTICSAFPPIQPGGTFTPACSGTGCGTPTNGGVSVLGGGIVRMTVNGITGGACAAGQTWTVTTSGATTDSADMGGTGLNQQMAPVTNFAVDSSLCDGGGGPTPPASQTAEYNFEGNLNDDSGNANHAVGSANITYTTSKDGQGVQLAGGTASYVDTGLLSGYNPSTNHLVVAFGVRINALGARRFLAGVGLGTNQRFYIRRDVDNIWDFAVQANGDPQNTEFPVKTGDTHVCVKFNPTTDTATLYIDGQAGTLSGASVQSYTSYTFQSALRFGLPSSEFLVPSTWTDIVDQAFVYDTDVSCEDIYAAWEPPIAAGTAAQVAHQWQGVYQLSGSPEDRGAVSEQRRVMKGGSASVVVQINNTSGAEATIQPRFRYNINGGGFNNVVPDTPTADMISMWGSAVTSGLNNGVADGPLTGALTHTNGARLFTSSAVPTIAMSNNTSYTLGGTFVIDAAEGTVVCFKVYDQSGQPLASHTPSDGACLTVIPAQASGGF